MIELYQSQGRKKWIDLGKGISMLMVVLFHTEVYFPIVETGTMQIFSFFRMPFFFFLSGYVFTSNYRQFSLKRKLKQILRGIVWTYLIICSILVIPKCLFNGTPLSEGLESILLGWASWFVVALGMAQLMFALVLSKIKNLTTIAVFLVVSVAIGLLIKHFTDELLPFQLDKAFFVVFYFGLGFFYRIFENKFSRIINWKTLLAAIVVYALLMTFEKQYMHFSTGNVFWCQFQNFPLFMVYTFSGVVMMLLIVRVLPADKLNAVCYIGANSLLFYYLNGGVIKLWRFVYNQVSIYVHINNVVAFIAVFMLVVATLTMLVLAVKKYCPILVGDKKAFQRCFTKIEW